MLHMIVIGHGKDGGSDSGGKRKKSFSVNLLGYLIYKSRVLTRLAAIGLSLVNKVEI